MRKFLLSIVFLSLSTFIVQAANTETRRFGEFHSVYFFGNIEVEMIKSDSNYAVLSADYLELGTVSTVLENGQMVIKNLSMTNAKGLNIKFYYKALDEVIAKAGVKLKAAEVFESKSFKIRLSKGAKANIKVKSDTLIADVVQGSTLIIGGESSFLDVNTNSGSLFEGIKFTAHNVVLKSIAGATIEVRVTGELNANTNTGGKVYYYGTPTIVSQKALTGGIIERKK
jgi:hypothetical protein